MATHSNQWTGYVTQYRGDINCINSYLHWHWNYHCLCRKLHVLPKMYFRMQ